MKKEKEGMDGSAICGGVMSFSMSKKGMKRYGVYFGMMSFLMPDKQYKKYCEYIKSDKKKAQKIFDKYALSQI